MDSYGDNSAGLKGARVAVDWKFAYYKGFTWPEHARHIKAEGFSGVDLVAVDLSVPAEKQNEIIDAFHAEGVACMMRLFPPTEPNLHAAHPEWRQVMLGGGSRHDWRTYCCPNNEEFVSAYCERIAETLKHCRYDGVQLAESWFEVWGGPYPNNPSRDKYACLCGACREKFRTLSGVDPVELFDSEKAACFLKEKNRSVYQKWVQFRIDTIIEFDRRILEAAGRARPGIFTEVMFLSDCMHNRNGSREFQAQDLERLVMDLQPDGITIQDAWQEWLRADLKPEFIQGYATEYIPRIRRLKPSIVIHSHADIGSHKNSKRSSEWIQRFREESRKSGFDEATFYEYSVSVLAPKAE